MNHRGLQTPAVLSAIVLLGLTISGAYAQNAEVKEKPPMYTYMASWQFPRAHWGEIDKFNAAGRKIVDQALAAGKLVGYGDDEILVHHVDGATHDNWWSALSMAAVLDVLASLASAPPDKLLTTATKHDDAIYVSHYYNWRPGTYKDAYTHAGYYKLKPDAANDAVDTMSKGFIVPLMEKLLADGTIAEYEVDDQAIHSESPDGFWIVYLCPTSAGLDKVNAALGAAMQTNPMAGPALSSWVDFSAHRDYLDRTSAVFK